MDGDSTMSGNPSLNALVQQAKSLGIWKDSFCAMLHDEAQSSFLSTVLLQLITAETENKALKMEVITVKTENKALKMENHKVKRERKGLKTEIKERSLEILKADTRALVNRTDSAPDVEALRYQPAKIKRVDYDFMNGITVPYDVTYTQGDKSVDSKADVLLFVVGILKPISSGIAECANHERKKPRHIPAIIC